MPMEWLSQLARRALDAWHERAIVLKAVSFAVVGLVNSAVDFGVFSFAYYYLALPIVAANVIAWIVAVTGSYVMNSLTTFARESKRELTLKAYAGFAASQIAGLVANTATVVLASYFMPVLDRQGARHRRELPGQFLAVALRRVPEAARHAHRRTLSLRAFPHAATLR